MINQIDIERAKTFGKDAYIEGLNYDPSLNDDFLSFFADDIEEIEILAQAYVLGWTLEKNK